MKPQFILRNHLKLRKPISKLEAVDDRRAILLTADGQLWLLDIEKMELIKPCALLRVSFGPIPASRAREHFNF